MSNADLETLIRVPKYLPYLEREMFRTQLCAKQEYKVRL